MALWDLANSDVIVVMGSNMAENHPIGFRFVMQAKARGATLIHVDPRFTRTSAMADIHAPVRSGSDIAFLGGLIHHVLEHDLWFRDYALNYTNIAKIIDERYVDAEDGDGLFSGFDPANGSYKTDSWQYKDHIAASPLEEHQPSTAADPADGKAAMQDSPPPSDLTLQDPNCVYQIMRRHYARYTPEMVERVTGCPRETFLKVADAIARNSGREKTGAFCYAVGWTHSTVGVQIIRACSILQALLGNMGRPGGGIMALRGHCSIQGSTDIPTLYNMLPTYLPQPNTFLGQHDLASYMALETVPTGWWHNFPKYFVSLMKAWYGDAATQETDWAFDNLPKLTGDLSQQPMTMAMVDGVVRGQFIMGQNPVVGAVNSDMVTRGLAKLDWLVVRDMAMIETASFWQKGRLVQSGEISPATCPTEIFLMPSAISGEKAGSVTNTSRLVQWHDKACQAPGDSRSDLWFIYHLGRRLKAMYAGSTRPEDRAIQELTWDYPVSDDAEREPAADAVLAEINGRHLDDGRMVEKYQDLKDDGSTSCGGWMYCGVMPKHGHNVARSRKPDGPDGPGSHLGWAFAWPSNRRTLYNRASADPDGAPWSERKKLVWWNEVDGQWTGTDVPDFLPDRRPDYVPDWSTRPAGMDAHSGHDPFIMLADGQAALFTPNGIKDGPLPTHYEPVESPVHNPLYAQEANPGAKRWVRPGNELHDVADPDYPYILTTYRLTELQCGGISSRITPHTAELQPEAFVEIPPELADRLGIAHLGWTTLTTKRGSIEVKAMVTERLRPFVINGETIYQVGMPWVFGWEGMATGDIANVLLAIVGDPETSIHTTKALTCNLRSGRRRTGSDKASPTASLSSADAAE